MKRISKLLFFIILIIPMFVNARVKYDDGVAYANNYIHSFNKYRDYLFISDRAAFVYDGIKNEVDSDFKSGGFLNKSEYEISNVKGDTYLATGLEYWTLTQSSANKHFIVNYKLEELQDTKSSGVRVTEFVQQDTRVSGSGSIGDPWVFVDMLNMHINSTNVMRGKVSNFRCSDGNAKESITVKFAQDSETIFYACPEVGFKYDGLACRDYFILDNSNKTKITVSGVKSDNLICNLNFVFDTNKVILNTCSECSAASPNTLYYSHAHSKWFTDEEGYNEILSKKMTSTPTKTGYTFDGYKYNGSDIIDKNGNLLTNNDVPNNTSLNPTMNANSYTITYDANGGTEIDYTSKSLKYDSKYQLPGVKRPGYTFAGWYTQASGGTKVTTNTTIKTASNHTLYAHWTSCPAGTYTDDSISCKTCANGYYSTGGAGSCTQCPAGYRDGGAATARSECIRNVEASYYIAAANDTTNTKCGTGYYKGAHSVKYGSTSTCVQCPAGYRNGAGTTAENQCIRTVAAGYIIATAKATTNTACATGYYKGQHSVKYGATSTCVQCPAGYRNGAGTTAQTECIRNVEASYYIASANDTTNTRCATGYYKGQHSVKYGATSQCDRCPAGYRDGAGTTAQGGCIRVVPDGHYIASTNATTNTPCAVKTYKTSHSVNYGNTSSCSPCSTCYTNTAGSASCPTLITYAVTYNANGGSGAPSSQTKRCGTNLALSSTKPTRANYEFTGWSGSDGNTYAVGGSYTGNAALTLTAQWRALDTVAPTCTLSISSNGSTINATYGDNSGNVAYYGWSSSYSGTKSTSKTASAGTHKFYVKDAAGNTRTCSVTLNNTDEIEVIEGTCDEAALTYAHQNSCNYSGGCNVYNGVYDCKYNSSTDKCECIINAFRTSSGGHYCCNCDDTWFTGSWNASVQKYQCEKTYSPTTKASTGCSSDEFAYKYGWCAKYW